MRTGIALLLLAGLAPAPAGAEPDSALACPAFKQGWTAALERLDPGRAPLSFAPAPNRNRPGERVEGLSGGVEGWLGCPEGRLAHAEIRDPGAPGGEAALGRAAAALLMAFDGEIAPDQAAGLVAALRAEARPGRDAVSAWGAYEITFGRGAGGRAEFSADLHGN